jgi:hypothetical protein
VQARAHVVHQPVDPLMPVERGRHQLANLGRVGHVGGHGQGPAEFLAQRGQPVGPAGGEHGTGAGGVQQSRGGLADAGVTAFARGEDRNAPVAC